MGRNQLIFELMKEREKYKRLREMERHVHPDYVDVLAYKILASEKRLEALRRELAREMEAEQAV